MNDDDWTRGVIERMKNARLATFTGRVCQVADLLIECMLPNVAIGELCHVYDPGAPARKTLCEVVGFRDARALLAPLGRLDGISTAFVAEPLGAAHQVRVGRGLLGRVLDGFGNPMDAGGPLPVGAEVALVDVIANAPLPVERPRIAKIMPTGVRAIDAFLTFGEGQRVGVFASPGCGKTTVLAAIARGSAVDVVVFGLVGERGREVREFTEKELPPDLLARSVIVCATSDRTPIERARAAFTATAIAEGFRRLGLKVLLLVDSLTRLARAQREIGLATGEPPARAGYPASVYSLLPKLIERAGTTERGSITACYTVLLDGEIKSDPISEEAVSLLDGHIILARKLAEQGHYPAIDVLPSISRVMSNIVTREHTRAAARGRQLLSRYADMELLIRLGEYRKGADPASDEAVAMNPKILGFLKQNTEHPAPWEESMGQFDALLGVR